MEEAILPEYDTKLEINKQTKINFNSKVLIIILIAIIILLIIAIIALSMVGVARTQEVKSISGQINGFNEKIASLSTENEDLKKSYENLKKKQFEELGYFVDYYLVKFLIEKSQKVAQSFRLNDVKNISGINLKGNEGAGDTIKISLYELTNIRNIENNPPLISNVFKVDKISKEEDFEVFFEKPINLKAKKEYVFVVEASDNLTQAGIGFAQKDITTDGNMFVFSKLLNENGEVVDEEHSWQAKNTQDVIYKLIETEQLTTGE